MINLKQLLTENTVASKPRLTEADHVQNGLQKVFAAGDVEISFRRCENVGLGYIKSISEAVKISMQESRKCAKMFGYREDADNAKFIKEDVNDFGKIDAQSPEGAMTKVSPEELPDSQDHAEEEKSEVRIANAIISIIDSINDWENEGEENMQKGMKIKQLAQELLKIHGVK